MRSLIALTFVSIVLATLTVVSVDRALEPLASVVEETGQSADWIAPSGEGSHTAYLQTLVELPAPPLRAWARIEARGGVVIYAERNPICKDLLWRPTRPDQNGLTSRGQRLRNQPPALALNFPREYQWGEGAVPRVGILVDLTPFLHAGANRLSVHVESRSPNAAARVTGEVILKSGQRLPLTTSSDWLANSVPTGGSVLSWLDGEGSSPAAAVVASPGTATLTLVQAGAFSTPFSGRWMEVLADEHVWFHTEFECATPPLHPWMRVLADHPYDLFVNDLPLTGRDVRRPAHAAGEWIFGTRAANDITANADKLDLDEVRSPFDLERYAEGSSRRDHPPLTAPTEQGDPSPSRDSRVIEDDPAQHLPRLTEEPPIELQRSPLRATPREDIQAPLSFIAHDLTRVLRPGRNVVSIRVAGTTRQEERSRALGVAVDGDLRDGGLAPWTVAGWTATGASGQPLPISTSDTPPAGHELPGLRWNPRRRSARDLVSTLEDTAPWAALYLACLLAVTLLERRRRGGAPAGTDVAIAAVPVLAAVAAVPLLAVAFAETREAWVFAMPGPWVAAIAICLCAPLLTALIARRPTEGGMGTTRGARPGPHPMLVAAVALLALLLRTYSMGAQPLDDDEYASMQAILRIAHTGLPTLASEDVMYTRGPLYHYLVAGFVLVFGDAVWVLRLPSAIFGVLTALLIQRMGARILGSGWLGLAAMLLYAVHPFCVFTGHVIRFYQQQQFFSLLTVHLFILGYVRSGPARLRKLTIVAWVAAVLTQEISVLLGFLLAAGFLLLRRGRRWREDLPVIGFGLVGAALIALDYACFKVLCQTRTEGVSPNVEARMGFNLIYPFNLAALFLGYARLHVLGSLLLVPSLVRGLRKQTRGVLGLHFVMFAGVLLCNVLITHVSLRYQYWLIPIWCLLVVHGGAALMAGIARATSAGGPVRARAVALGRGVILVALLAGFAPWRLPSSYGSTLLGDSTGAMEFIAAHRRADDRVFVTEPHSHAALLTAGRVDGYLSFPMLTDYHVVQDGVLVDRNGGAPVISRLSALQRSFQDPGRIWIAVNREKLRSRIKNMRWEYPGTRVELFLRENCVVSFETYLWTVFLWDPASGRWRGFDVTEH